MRLAQNVTPVVEDLYPGIIGSGACAIDSRVDIPPSCSGQSIDCLEICKNRLADSIAGMHDAADERNSRREVILRHRKLRSLPEGTDSCLSSGATASVCCQ